MKVKYIGLLAALLSWSLNASAVCEFYAGHRQNPVNLVIPSDISLPWDAPIGSVIFESPEVTLGTIASSYKCTAAFPLGIKNNVGTTRPGARTHPIGDTGIAWKVIQGSAEIGLQGYPSPLLNPSGAFGFNGVRYRLQLIKEAAVTGNTVIPSGILGYYYTGEISPIFFQTNGATLKLPTCETPDITVPMGTFTLSEIGSAPGSTATPVAFGIKLNNCPAGMNKISYSFMRVGETAGFRYGVIRLNSGSTAKGLGIQIKHSDGRPAVIDGVTQEVYDGYDSKGGNFEIPMTAAYYHIDNEALKPGTANAELSFIIEYL
ncbi:fimbrial protein [Pseudomonas sp. A34-9]|uniref:fimbrial protein n=1 Tax=Pseudomonas sp. A34-9 TaxID=3034675 RepID=UPI00240E049F|nr:fimbrial protein [Pseudomonas sp. A34-9]